MLIHIGKYYSSIHIHDSSALGELCPTIRPKQKREIELHERTVPFLWNELHMSLTPVSYGQTDSSHNKEASLIIKEV